MVLIYFFMAFVSTSEAALSSLQLKDKIINSIATSKEFKQDMLPSPYNYLLTQALMTLGIEQYYQRTPIIQTIFAQKNQHDNTYSRIIIMLVDSNQTRNDAKQALKIKEQIPVELALITMNFNELPLKFINDVLHSNVPFGKLLIKHHIKTTSSSRKYFLIPCNETFASLIHCDLNSAIYGRNNTITQADNQKWLAHVIEILPVAKIARSKANIKSKHSSGFN